MIDLPYLTSDLSGIGGRIKRFNEDFLVEELPRYEASGAGTHSYFQIEKQGITTLAAIDRIARALGRAPRDIGYAGMKDAHGVTRQWLSVEHVDSSRVVSLSFDRIRVLSVTRHTNKLKLGHLAGNRFTLRIREVGAESLPRASEILARLLKRGVPNYFGSQRFGARGDNAMIGRAVLLRNFDEAAALIVGRAGPLDRDDILEARKRFDAGDIEGCGDLWPRAFPQQRRLCRALIQAKGNAERAWRAVNPTMKKLYLSAFQSELFNRVTADRIQTLDRLEVGDLAWKHDNGACFRVEDAEREQPRCERLEISATGPLFGHRMTRAQGEPGVREMEALRSSGLTDEQVFDGTIKGMDGARRPMRVPLSDSHIQDGHDDLGGYLQLEFRLPPGAYATNVTREVCKNDGADGR